MPLIISNCTILAVMLQIHTETNAVSSSFCFSKGYLGGPFFGEHVTNNSGKTEYKKWQFFIETGSATVSTKSIF